jgi:hypothetical protein
VIPTVSSNQISLLLDWSCWRSQSSLFEVGDLSKTLAFSSTRFGQMRVRLNVGPIADVARFGRAHSFIFGYV